MDVPTCGSAATLLRDLHAESALIGAMEDGERPGPPFNLRYVYLAGGLPDQGVCAACGSGCSTQGRSCANSAGGCGWWGCWQWDQQDPGEHLRGFLARAEAARQVPFITYYELVQTSGKAEGPPLIAALRDVSLMRKWFDDLRFVYQIIGDEGAMVHLEPDLWGFAQQVKAEPSAIPAAVALANPTDCADLPNTLAGLGQCAIGMARKYAPRAKVGLHASPWATRVDVMVNRDLKVDARAEGRKTAAFLAKAGARQGDFIVLDMADRDAGFDARQGRNRWISGDPLVKPNLDQALAWGAGVAETCPTFWWQLPVGNPALPDVPEQWRDNRVDLFFDHLPAVIAAGAFGIGFGPGAPDQTRLATDRGHLQERASAAVAAGLPPVR